jgi:protein O-mannosyl-transferase
MNRAPKWILLLLGVAITTAWFNSLSGEFILDDKLAIISNPSIRHLWPLSTVLHPPNDGQTVTGRPLLNLSFALNWAASGKAVGSYHLLNVLIHAGAAALLFGVVRRTLRQPRLAERFGADAEWVGGVTALTWAIHPLLTESVTYISQRAESLAGLCYLATFYAFIRSTSEQSRWAMGWQIVAVLTALVGAACKETIVSVPLLILLYDRTFVAGRFSTALRRRRPLYFGLIPAWLLLGRLALGAGNRGHTAGFGLEINSWHYLLTQCQAVTHYFALAAWPAKLVLDYGFAFVTDASVVAVRGLLLTVLLVATVVAVARNRPFAVAAIAFFAVLAPSSSFIPVVTQTIAEHRMYLPLAALVIVGVTVTYAVAGRGALRAIAAGCLACGVVTAHRNRDYRTAIGMWRDTIAKAPYNARAYMELGTSLLDAGRAADAIPVIETALRLRPETPKAECNLGVALTTVGRYDEALPHFLTAANGMPARPEPLFGIGFDLLRLNRGAEAVPWFQRIVSLTPNDAKAHNNLAMLYEETRQSVAAEAEFEIATRCDPRDAAVRLSYGNFLSEAGRRSEAITQYRQALAADSTLGNAHLNLGALLIDDGHLDEGVKETKIALHLDPQNSRARANLDRANARLASR